MESKVFQLLEKSLNFDCAMIINSFFQDLMRSDILKSMKSMYPNEIEVWKRVNWDNSVITHYSRLIMHHPLHPAKVSTIRTFTEHQNLVGPYHMRDNLEKFLYINGKQYRICCQYITVMNRTPYVSEYKFLEKEKLLQCCKENDVTAYRSWKKTRIIHALLKA